MRESSNLKVSIWSAFVPGSALIMATTEITDSGQEQSSMRQLTAETSGLQKEVFGWRMAEDPLGGIVNDAERERLKVMLFDGLGMMVDPKKRSIAAVRTFVDDAMGVLAAGRAEWTGSQSLSIDDEDERRVNPLLALVNHLSWLIDVFEEQPNISVTVR